MVGLDRPSPHDEPPRHTAPGKGPSDDALLIPAAASLALLASSATAPAQEAAKADAIRDSVVKIFSTIRQPEYMRPWQKGSPHEASGSGMVVEGRRILTNAHVVLHASQVFVQPNGS